MLSKLIKEIQSSPNKSENIKRDFFFWIRHTIAIFIVLICYILKDIFFAIFKKRSQMSNNVVIHIPDYTETNLYQSLLSESLVKCGAILRLEKVHGLFALSRVSILSWKPQLIHIHWQHPFLLGTNKVNSILRSCCFIFELLVLKMLGIRFVWTVHNLINHDRKYENVEIFFTGLLARLCHAIIVHTPSARDAVVEKFHLEKKKSKVNIVPHGNYLCYPNYLDRSTARKMLGIPLTDHVFLFFGLIQPYKGVLELIEAFEQLNLEQTKLIIAGKSFNDGLNKIIQKKALVNHNLIIKAEFIPDDQIQVFMNASDIVAFPYKDVFTSGSAILAMSFGKPVISPAIGCVTDLFNSKGGFFYDPSDKQGLLNAMKVALNSDLVTMGDNNFTLATKIGWDQIGRLTHNVYFRVLSKFMEQNQDQG